MAEYPRKCTTNATRRARFVPRSLKDPSAARNAGVLWKPRPGSAATKPLSARSTNGVAEMALLTPDMSICTIKARCASGPNAGQVYDPASPCPEPFFFNPEKCDCEFLFDEGWMTVMIPPQPCQRGQILGWSQSISQCRPGSYAGGGSQPAFLINIPGVDSYSGAQLTAKLPFSFNVYPQSITENDLGDPRCGTLFYGTWVFEAKDGDGNVIMRRQWLQISQSSTDVWDGTAFQLREGCSFTSQISTTISTRNYFPSDYPDQFGKASDNQLPGFKIPGTDEYWPDPVYGQSYAAWSLGGVLPV